MTEFSALSLLPVLPEIFLAVSAMVLLIAGVFLGNAGTRTLVWAAVFCMGVSAALLLGQEWDRTVTLGGMFVLDQFAGFMKLLVLAGLAASLALSVQYLYQEQIVRFEYPILVMLAGAGMMAMISANDLIALYVALELQSLSLYVLAAIRRDSARSAEAGLKYFVLGALSSGMLLFGASLIYGFTGHTGFDEIAQSLSSEGGAAQLGAIVGLVFLMVGLAFKISAVPFHMWTPDVYEGAPTSVTALFAMVPKVAAIALLMRVLFEPFGDLAPEWGQVVYVLSLASMVLGAFAAIGQENIKRLMAYSSIGNMGYAMLGIVAGTEAGAGAVILYMLIYMAMTAGVFGIVLSMRRDNIELEKIGDLAGLSRNSPVKAYAMAVLMFSMSGIPPMAGFFAKLFVFEAAVEQGLYVLATLGVLTSVVAAYYYLRIIKVMFFDDPVDAFDPGASFPRRAVVLVSVLFILGFVVAPSVFVESTASAASALFGK